MFHLRNCLGVNYHSKFKCKYCLVTFPKNNRAFHAHKDESKMYADATKNSTKRKRKDEARKTAKTKAGKSGTGLDFVLDDESIRLCACASETLLAMLLALSDGLTSLFGAAKETPQAAVPTPPNVTTWL